MKAKGIVTKINGSYATVVSERNSACSSCHECKSKGSCHAELIFGNQKQDVTVTAKNAVGAKFGDTVELESSTFVTLICSFFVFVFPFFVTAAFYFLAGGQYVNSRYLPLVLIAVFCTSFFVLGLIFNSFIRKKHSIYIVKVLEESKGHFETE